MGWLLGSRRGPDGVERHAMYFLYGHSGTARATGWECLWQDVYKRTLLKKLADLAASPCPVWTRFRLYHQRPSRLRRRLVAQGTLGQGTYALEDAEDLQP